MSVFAKNTLNSILVGIVSFFYAHIYWSDIEFVRHLVSLDLERPFVYRQFVPFLVRLSPAPENVSVIALTILFGVGFYLSLQKLLWVFGVDNEIIALAVAVIGMLAFHSYRTVYDMATAFLWTTAFLLLFTGRRVWYMVLFPFLCFNRIDTAPFLIMAYVFFYRDWRTIIYQCVVFSVIFFGLRVYFSGNPGLEAWIEPVENIQKYLGVSVWYLIGMVGVAGLILHRVKNKPANLRRVWFLLFPIFIALHIIFGQAFEFRVLWEIYPLTACVICQ